jgi:hypothetical protein
MCKDWILDPVRTIQRTKLSQRSCSPLTLPIMINTALFTAQNTYALLVISVEVFPWADTMVETVHCNACHYMSHIVFFLRPYILIVRSLIHICNTIINLLHWHYSPMRAFTSIMHLLHQTFPWPHFWFPNRQLFYVVGFSTPRPTHNLEDQFSYL